MPLVSWLFSHLVSWSVTKHDSHYSPIRRPATGPCTARPDHRHSSVGRQTRPPARPSGEPCSIPRRGRRLSSSFKCPERFRDPSSLLFNGHRICFPRGKAAGAWNWALTEVKNECSYISTLL